MKLSVWPFNFLAIFVLIQSFFFTSCQKDTDVDKPSPTAASRPSRIRYTYRDGVTQQISDVSEYMLTYTSDGMVKEINRIDTLFDPSFIMLVLVTESEACAPVTSQKNMAQNKRIPQI